MTQDYIAKGADGIPLSLWVFKAFANADGNSNDYLSVGSLTYICPPGANKKWIAHTNRAVDDIVDWRTLNGTLTISSTTGEVRARLISAAQINLAFFHDGVLSKGGASAVALTAN